MTYSDRLNTVLGYPTSLSMEGQDLSTLGPISLILIRDRVSLGHLFSTPSALQSRGKGEKKVLFLSYRFSPIVERAVGRSDGPTAARTDLPPPFRRVSTLDPLRFASSQAGREGRGAGVSRGGAARRESERAVRGREKKGCGWRGSNLGQNACEGKGSDR